LGGGPPRVAPVFGSRARFLSTCVAGCSKALGAQIKGRQAAEVDQDGDGIGEHGFLGELAGNADLRDPGGVRRANPAYLPLALQTDANGNASSSGYLLTVYLPDGNNAALGEAGNVGVGGVQVNAADAQESTYVCYAWPLQNDRTGSRAFVVIETGEIYHTNMVASTYDGTNSIPQANAVYVGNPLASSLGVGPAAVANDGNIWVPAGG